LTDKLFYSAGEDTASESVEIDYDDLGRQSKVTKTVAGVVTRETTYSYNSLNQLEQISTPEGDVNYTYHPKTGQKTRTWTDNTSTGYDYDALGRLKTVTDNNNGVTTYNYTAVGSRESMELPNGITTTYQYNNLNRLTNLTHKNSSDELLSSYTYTLAPNGRRTAVAEQSRTAAPALSPLYNRNITYQYDNLNRLVAETSTCDDTNQPELTYNSEYSYALTGSRLKHNFISFNPYVTTYTYNDNDQLIDETKSVTDESDVVTNYLYDANGSQLSKVSDTGDSYYYTYNLQNRLSTAIINRTEGGNTVALTTEYTYNQSGIRVRAKSTPSGSSLTTEKAYLLDAGLTGYAQVLEEKEVNADNTIGYLIKSYTLGDDVISQKTNHNSSFVIHNLLYDGHGSTRLLAGSSGTIAETYDYDAYGKNLFDTSNTATNMLYSGEQFDPNLQMQYLRARYYDQNNGTFNRLDPFNGNMGDPQSLHKYAYCHGDPVNGWDPSGESSITSIMCATTISMTVLMMTVGVLAKKNPLQAAITGFAGGAALGYLILTKRFKNIGMSLVAGAISSGLGFSIDFLRGKIQSNWNYLFDFLETFSWAAATSSLTAWGSNVGKLDIKSSMEQAWMLVYLGQQMAKLLGDVMSGKTKGQIYILSILRAIGEVTAMLVSSIIMKFFDKGFVKLLTMLNIPRRQAKTLVKKAKEVGFSMTMIKSPAFRIKIVRTVVMGGVSLFGKRIGVSVSEAEKSLNKYY
jgi:RHS repeat-associated protein